MSFSRCAHNGEIKPIDRIIDANYRSEMVSHGPTGNPVVRQYRESMRIAYLEIIESMSFIPRALVTLRSRAYISNEAPDETYSTSVDIFDGSMSVMR